MKTFLLLALLLLPLSSWSFPENVRHGYFNCTACHVSPSGGGVLTPYGRALSAELMSTWGTTKTSGFLFSDNDDEKRNPPWFRAGIFLRGVQIRRDSPTVEKAQFIPMQADLEAGVDAEKYAIIIAGGFRAGDSSTKDLNQFFSRRHYILYRLSDTWTLRGGKFLFSIGLNGPDHISATRRGLSWDQGSESYNLELSYNAEKSSTILSLVSKNPEEKGVTKDSGLAINQSFFIGEKSKLGVSGFYGQQTDYQRVVAGPYWIWSITDQLFLDSEVFFQNKKIKPTDNTQNGYATFHRLGYEYIKGLTPFIQFDRSFLDNKDQNTKFDSYGAGVQWLPYPHFETMAFVGKEKPSSQDATDFWWLMLNIYL